MSFARVGSIAVLLGALSCGPALDESPLATSVELRTSRHEARVTPKQAELAMALVESTKEYLPFSFTEDGCYARALYMSMELAARKIPSSAQYIHGTLAPSPSILWRYHVAPMIEIEGDGERTILDPSLAPQGPVTLPEWVQLVNPVGQHLLVWTHGSDLLSGAKNEQETPVIQSFAEMTPFKSDEVAFACWAAYNYLGYEQNSGTGVQERRQLLLRRTRTLADRLEALGKLESKPDEALDCGGASLPFPTCSEVDAACSTNLDCCSMRCEAGTCQARPVDLLPDPLTSPSSTPSP